MDEHYVTGCVLYDLALGYFKNKNYQIALEYAEKALNLRKKIYYNIKNHYHLAESLHNLAEINVALGNKNNGLQLYKESLEMYLALSLEQLPAIDKIKKNIKELDSV